MEELENVLKSAVSILDALKDERKKVNELTLTLIGEKTKLMTKEQELKALAESLGDLVKAQDVWGQIKLAQDQLHADRVSLDKEKEVFANSMVEVKEKIEKQRAELVSIREEADQVRLDKLALEEEKRTYRDKIKEEILNNIKVGKF